jgi:hypothetical protein
MKEGKEFQRVRASFLDLGPVEANVHHVRSQTAAFRYLVLAA